MAGRWAETRPADVERWLRGARLNWWIAGGWALDLWLGRQTRQHSDLEIGCFRLDLPALGPTLAGWEVCHAHNKRLNPFDLNSPLPEPPFSLWVRQPQAALWSFEILVEEREGDLWRYRRDLRVTRPVAELTVTDRDGRRIVAPEVQLLYKAKQARPKDEADFELVAALLAPAARTWLRQALTIAHPEHPWLARI